MPGERDLDRALDARGRCEAQSMAGTMAVNGFLPAQVLCSPARRCIETWRTVEETSGFRVPVRYCVELYAKGHDAYVDLIAAAAGPSVLLVGHNPMMDDTARALVYRNGGAFDGPLASGFPAGALAIIDLPDQLSSAPAGKGRLSGFLTPGDC